MIAKLRSVVPLTVAKLCLEPIPPATGECLPTANTNFAAVNSTPLVALNCATDRGAAPHSAELQSGRTPKHSQWPPEPKIFPLFKVCSRFFCQENQPGEFFSKEKTPMFICGAKANFLALLIPIFDLIACLKF